jgi:hypothetical protein
MFCFFQSESSADVDRTTNNHNSSSSAALLFHPEFSWKFSSSKKLLLLSDGDLSKLTPRKKREANQFKPSLQAK